MLTSSAARAWEKETPLLVCLFDCYCLTSSMVEIEGDDRVGARSCTISGFAYVLVGSKLYKDSLERSWKFVEMLVFDASPSPLWHKVMVRR